MVLGKHLARGSKGRRSYEWKRRTLNPVEETNYYLTRITKEKSRHCVGGPESPYLLPHFLIPSPTLHTQPGNLRYILRLALILTLAFATLPKLKIATITIISFHISFFYPYLSMSSFHKLCHSYILHLNSFNPK